jgi:hypothetical protein
VSGVDLAAILAFVNARLDERERVAQSASSTSAHWEFSGTSSEGPKVTIDSRLTESVWYREIEPAVWTCDDEQDGCPEIARSWSAEGRHIALNDPQFVLDDVAAKRRIVDELERVADSGHLDGGGRCYDCGVMPERLLRLLAAPFAQHPDFDPAWAVEGTVTT